MSSPRLKAQFQGPVSEKIKSDFGIQNPMSLPRIEKVVLNVGMGRELDGTKLRPAVKEQVLKDLTVISGQKPVTIRARKSVSNFKLRAGYEIGAMVTLRGDRMWEFLDRLINLAIPRIKDFRGVNEKSFDGRGSYAFGVNEQGIFPEVDMASAQYTHGMNINVVFKNSTDEISRAVLTELGMPFRKKNQA